MFALAAVTAGAFGAHYLGTRLTVERLGTYETAVRYQLYHAFALLASAWAADRLDGRLAAMAGWAFILGIVLFSGSLYLLIATGIGMLGAVTPLGGAAFLAGWALLATSFRRHGNESRIGGDG